MERTAEARRALLGKVIARAWDDENYKARLMNEPRAVLAEAGLDVPSGVEITVSEQKPGTFHLALPPKPEREGALDDTALEAVAGGTCACWQTPCALCAPGTTGTTGSG